MSDEQLNPEGKLDPRVRWLFLSLLALRGMVEDLCELARSWVGREDAFDYDAFGFKVGDAMVGAVTHVDCLLEKSDEWPGGFREPAVVGLIPVDGEVVGGVAFGAGERSFQPALKGSTGEFADGVGA